MCGGERSCGPCFMAGSHERSRRAGTENVPGIVGLGKAAELAMQAFERGDDRKISAMRDRLEQGILAQVEDAGVNGAVRSARAQYCEYLFRAHRRRVDGDFSRSEGAGGLDRGGVCLGRD